jgi:uncharacterized membrane protein
MLKKLKETNKLKQILLISLITAFGSLLLFTRMYKTGSYHFLFLVWNLFLAGIPWVISTALILFPNFRKRLVVLLISGFFWILFIPNSFYILTDLFHLNYKNLAPIWYDLVLIFSFAWAGIILGFAALQDAEEILSERINKKLIPFFSITVLFLISFGIYLGRVLRWNSWNIINEPAGLLSDIKERITDPFDHPGTWGMTIVIGILLNLIWWSIKTLQSKSTAIKIENTY